MQVPYRHSGGRAVWLQFHLYFALLFGLLFALIGLTGSLSVYREEIDTLLDPQPRADRPSGEALVLDKIIASVRKAHPNRHGAWTLELPRSEDAMITAWFEKPRESVDAFYAPLMVSVDPYSGEVIASRFWGQTPTTWLLDLHSHLLQGSDGRLIMAAAAVLLALSVVSGLYLWWPTAGWRRAFAPRLVGDLKHLLLDLHRLLGLCSAGILLLLAFTGFHLAYPQLLENLTASAGMGHGDEGPNVRSTAVPNNHPVSLAEAILVARGLFPSSEVRRITTPVGELGTYRINLRQKNELNQHHPFTTVWVDRWSGQIRSVNNPSQFSPGQTFTTWQWPLHTGEAFGDAGRLIWFVTGLMPMTLYLTGLYHWLSRTGRIQAKRIDAPRIAMTALLRADDFIVRLGRKAWQAIGPSLMRRLRALGAHWHNANRDAPKDWFD